MPQNFLEIQKEYLRKVWLRPSEELEKVLPAQHLEEPNPSFRWRVLILLLFLSWFVSCAGVSPPDNTQPFRMIRNVPFYPQEEYQCGPASLAGVLNHWNINVSPEEIASEIYSKSARGTLNIDMVLYVEKIGLKARQYRGSFEDIKTKIDSGYPLIVLVDEGFLIYQKNHFMVVIGYGGEGIVVNSGKEQSKFIPAKEFLRSWERTKFWTLFITPN
jgi:predicted double-glycine peptidase